MLFGKQNRLGPYSLSAFGSVKDYPEQQIIREILETVSNPRRNKEKISGLYPVPHLRIEKFTAALNHNVNLISRVWLLRINVQRREDFDHQAAVLKNCGEAFTLRVG